MLGALPLTQATLAHHAARVAVPAYHRAALTPAVVHLSVGHFHRSHQAVYLDELAGRGATEWGLVGVGLQRRAMRDALVAQDCLYTVVERGIDGDRARVVGVMGRYLFSPTQREAVVEALADRRTRLVTLTVTGAGYHVDPADGTFNPRHPEIAADLACPERPRSAVGHLVEALARRRRRGLGPFTVLSCDNLAANGDTARTAVLSFARLRDERLARWVEDAVAFPNSMVDRITPSTTREERELVAREFGIDDRWPVITEPFSDWVIEDAFCAGRPPLEDVGVRFVADVRPHALMKTRLLNATHCALGPLGSLAGYDRTDEVMAEPEFRAYVERMMEREISPILPRVAGFDLPAYRRTLVGRISNPKIPDQLARLSRGGSVKVPRHVLTSIVASRRQGRAHPLLTLAVAGWCRSLRGVDERGRRLVLDDPLVDRLRALATAGGTDPRPLLGQWSVFGTLGQDEAFAAELEDALVALERDGARATIRRTLVGEQPVAA